MESVYAYADAIPTNNTHDISCIACDISNNSQKNEISQNYGLHAEYNDSITKWWVEYMQI